MTGITTREMSPSLQDDIKNGAGGSVLIGATRPVDATNNALWLRTGIGDSESGTIGGNVTNPDLFQGVMVKNAKLAVDEPEHETTLEVPFWFKEV